MEIKSAPETYTEKEEKAKLFQDNEKKNLLGKGE